MHKRTFKWALIGGTLSFWAAIIIFQPSTRALFSFEFWQNLARYSRVMRLVETEYVHADNVSYEELTDVALRESVRSLDKYSDYMIPDDFETFNMASNQEYVGVGIELTEFGGQVRVTQVFEGGSAAAAGLLAGDVIVAVDGESVRSESLSEVSELVRGEPGTAVVLEIERMGEGNVLPFEMERRAIILDAVVDIEMKTPTVGYCLLRQFTEMADVELAAAILQLEAQGMQSFILDLRGNPGGRLDSAALIADLFLTPGQTIVTVESRRGLVETVQAEPTTGGFDGPMAILIDDQSASASEILAGACRDHGRAILVGEQTFGKGSVQSVFEFRGGHGLKLTTARYLLPLGEAINGTGVAPDVTVELSREDSYVRVLQRHHLREMDAAAFESRFGFAPVEDAPLQVAQGILSTASPEG